MPSETTTLSLPVPDTATQVFKGITFSVYQWPQELYDGSTATFERIKRPDSAGVIAISPDHKIILTYQEQPLHKPFWGLLGGVVDPGEQPLESAKRELKEEGGFAAPVWKEWFSFRPSVRIEWTIHLFIAQQVTKVIEPHPEPGEKITIHELTFEEFLEVVQRPDFRDSEVALEVLKAMVNQQKMTELKQLFFG
jgi:ADP-ribose pyrophosphatase